MTVAANLAMVRQRIEAACRRCGREAAAVRVVAVTKTHPAEAVAEAIAAGVDAIGENRVQEAASKRPLVMSALPWHLIGPLQRNKARLALDVFEVIESIDRPVIADRLEQLAAERPIQLPVFLEVNIAGEASKHGVPPAETGALLAHVLARCPHLSARGLMTVPPWSPDAERARPHFAALRGLADRLVREGSIERLDLSMGMSDDFEVAVEEGATWVRLGRILFGARREVPVLG